MLALRNDRLLRAVCLSLAIAARPLGAQQIGTGAFPDTGVIEKQLQRGASRKSDVQRALGVPNGTGQSDWLRPPGMPPAAHGEGPREIWFYDDIRITDMKSGDGPATMKVRQQILLVFFKGEIFDGYLWTSNALAPSVER